MAGGLTTIAKGLKDMPDALKKKIDDVADLWKKIAKNADDILAKKVASIKAKYPNSKVGYRGSLANGAKYNKDFKKRGGDEYLPFKPDDWDVDAFIIDDDLAAKFPPNERFRDVRSNGIDNDLKNICDDLENSFKLENGYRIEARKPFTFAVWTTQDFENKIKDFGYKILE